MSLPHTPAPHTDTYCVLDDITDKYKTACGFVDAIDSGLAEVAEDLSTSVLRGMTENVRAMYNHSPADHHSYARLYKSTRTRLWLPDVRRDVSTCREGGLVHTIRRMLRLCAFSSELDVSAHWASRWTCPGGGDCVGCILSGRTWE